MKGVNFVTSLVLPIITTTRRMLMKMRTPVTAFQMTSLHWQRSVSVKRTRGGKLNLSQPQCIGRWLLPLLFKSINRYKLYTFWKTLKNDCVPSNSGRWHHRPHLWEFFFFFYVGIHLTRPNFYHGDERFHNDAFYFLLLFLFNYHFFIFLTCWNFIDQ